MATVQERAMAIVVKMIVRDIEVVRNNLLASGRSLEFLYQGRRYQISSIKGMSGFWERCANRTRRRVSKEEIAVAFADGENFRMFESIADDSGQDVTRDKILGQTIRERIADVVESRKKLAAPTD